MRRDGDGADGGDDEQRGGELERDQALAEQERTDRLDAAVPRAAPAGTRWARRRRSAKSTSAAMARMAISAAATARGSLRLARGPLRHGARVGPRSMMTNTNRTTTAPA